MVFLCCFCFSVHVLWLWGLVFPGQGTGSLLWASTRLLSARLLSALCSEPRSGESASLGVEGPQGRTRLTAGLAATVPSRLTQGAGLSLLATSGHPQGDGTLETDLEMCVHYASLTVPPLPC